MSRPPESPHHSSTIQSLYAFTQSSASSLSSASVKVWPQKRGKVGKHKAASMWFTSMSSSLGLTSYEPGRMSSNVTPFMVTSSRGTPTAESTRSSGRFSSS